ASPSSRVFNRLQARARSYKRATDGREAVRAASFQEATMRAYEFAAEMESGERIFARTHPGGVIASDDALELFNYLVDSADPRAEHLTSIRSAAVRLAARAFTDDTFAIEIVGHASDSGTPALNMPLARLRARRAADEFLRAVRGALISRGVDLGRIELFLGD